jgi:hypothetical protein
VSDNFLDTRPWPASSDVRRLDAVFERLNAQGVLAVHNGPCCPTCVGGYIWSEAVPAAQEAGRPAIGYVFYTEQTSDSVAEGADLILVCGAVPELEAADERRAATERITALVRQELEAAGLRPAPTEDCYYVLRVPLSLKD